MSTELVTNVSPLSRASTVASAMVVVPENRTRLSPR